MGKKVVLYYEIDQKRNRADRRIHCSKVALSSQSGLRRHEKDLADPEADQLVWVSEPVVTADIDTFRISCIWTLELAMSLSCD